MKDQRSNDYEAMLIDANGAYESRKVPVYGSGDEEQSEASDAPRSFVDRGPPELHQYCMCFCVCFVAATIWALLVGIHITLRTWECDPSAPSSVFGEEFLPMNFTLDESAIGAFASFWYGPTVNVLQGVGPALGSSPVIRQIGFFCEVWAWPGQAYGYVESSPQGTFLRFKATRPWHWFFEAPPWTVEPCASEVGALKYQIQRSHLLDSARHTIYKANLSSGERVDLGVAEHVANGLEVGASLFGDGGHASSASNLERLVFKAASPNSTTVLLAEARQWFDRSTPLAIDGTPSWAVTRVKEGAVLPEGVEPLPGSVVAFTSALYDLTVGSARRRRTRHRAR